MGGNALKKCKLRRFAREEYKALEAKVLDIISSVFTAFAVPAYLPSKDSFGDVDVLVIGESVDEVKEVATLFDSKEVVRNGNVVSCEFRDFQVDVIVVPSRKFDVSNFFYGYSDFGSILGRMCSFWGLKFGGDGLFVKVYCDMQPGDKADCVCDRKDPCFIGRLDLTSDLQEIADFMGIDLQTWEIGFDSEEEVFAFLTSSRLFHLGAFSSQMAAVRSKVEEGEEGRHTSCGTDITSQMRKRIATRPFYIRFLQYLDAHHTVDGKTSMKPDDRFEFLGQALDRFGKGQEFNQLFKDHQGKMEAKEKWNARVVQSSLESHLDYPLVGKLLGMFMSEFKRDTVRSLRMGSIKDQEVKDDVIFNQWVLQTDKTDIQKQVLSKYLDRHSILQ